MSQERHLALARQCQAGFAENPCAHHDFAHRALLVACVSTVLAPGMSFRAHKLLTVCPASILWYRLAAKNTSLQCIEGAQI